jgi:hypothetical protein
MPVSERFAPTLEIRIPISPTQSFFNQVRFFTHCLRTLGPLYEKALVRVVVGDNADMDAVRAANNWSAGAPVEFIGVPQDIFDRYGIHGTADYRHCLAPVADVIVLADADTIWLRDIDPLLREFHGSRLMVAGHMAHLPPPEPPEADIPRGGMWPWLFDRLELAMPDRLYPYSMDPSGAHGLVPPYFNLGFVALSPCVAAACGERVFAVQDDLLEVFPSHMRCQIAVTVMALEQGAELRVLSAEYNTANDPLHISHHGLTADQVRVLHYLRTKELDRSRIVLPENAAETASRQCELPLNRLLQQRVLRFLQSELNAPV